MKRENVKKKIECDAKDHGYYLNSDQEFLKDLIIGLKNNLDRYGYMSCPCRLASGILEFDRDIICPCDYRDQDVEEYGYCYCALFTNKSVHDGKTPIKPIPERRPSKYPPSRLAPLLSQGQCRGETQLGPGRRRKRAR